MQTRASGAQPKAPGDTSPGVTVTVKCLGCNEARIDPACEEGLCGVCKAQAAAGVAPHGGDSVDVNAVATTSYAGRACQ